MALDTLKDMMSREDQNRIDKDAVRALIKDNENRMKSLPKHMRRELEEENKYYKTLL